MPTKILVSGGEPGAEPPQPPRTPTPQRAIPGRAGMSREEGARLTFAPTEPATGPLERMRGIARKYNFSTMPTDGMAIEWSAITTAFWQLVQQENLHINREKTVDPVLTNLQSRVSEIGAARAYEEALGVLLAAIEMRQLSFQEISSELARLELIDLPAYVERWLAGVGSAAFPNVHSEHFEQGLHLTTADLERHRVFAAWCRENRMHGRFMLTPPLARDQILHAVGMPLVYPPKPTLTQEQLQAHCAATLPLPLQELRKAPGEISGPVQVVALDAQKATIDPAAIQALYARVAQESQPPRARLVQFATDEYGEVPQSFRGKSLMDGYDPQGRFAPVDITVPALFWRLIEVVKAQLPPDRQPGALQETIALVNAIAQNGKATAIAFRSGQVPMWTTDPGKQYPAMQAGPLVGVTT